MTGTAWAHHRTGGDVVVGVLLVVAAAYVFGNVVLATELSVLVLGWTALLGGVAVVADTVGRARSGASRSLAAGGVVLAVLGLFLLRNPVAGALTLTLVAGALLLTTGMTRLFAAIAVPEARGPLVVSGGISAALGLLVLLDLATATPTLLGVLLGAQTLLDGLTLIAVGRLRPTRPAAAGARAGTAPSRT